jgi:CBF1 interacting corepressor
MYEAPKGLNREDKDKSEPEFKFEWQRVAPRENYAKNNMEIRDQPFGIAVRNVKCLKCHKWGHINTDKECPMFNESSSLLNGGTKLKQNQLIEAMKEDGLRLKRSALDVCPDEDLMAIKGDSEKTKEANAEAEDYFKGMTYEQKKALLKRLNQLIGDGANSKNKKRNKKVKQEANKKRSKSKRSSSVHSHDSNRKSRQQIKSYDEKERRQHHHRR